MTTIVALLALAAGAALQSAPAPHEAAATAVPAAALCDLNRAPGKHVGQVVRVVAVHNALDYARVAFLSGGPCAPLDVVPTLPRARTRGDASVTAFFDEAARICAGQKACGTLRLVDADVLVRRAPGTGAQVEFQRVHRSRVCPTKKACTDALAEFSR